MDKILEGKRKKLESLENAYRTEKENNQLDKLQKETGLEVLWKAQSLLTGEVIEAPTRAQLLGRIGAIERSWLTEQREKRNRKPSGKPAKKVTKKARKKHYDKLAYQVDEPFFDYNE